MGLAPGLIVKNAVIERCAASRFCFGRFPPPPPPPTVVVPPEGLLPTSGFRLWLFAGLQVAVGRACAVAEDFLGAAPLPVEQDDHCG